MSICIISFMKRRVWLHKANDTEYHGWNWTDFIPLFLKEKWLWPQWKKETIFQWQSLKFHFKKYFISVFVDVDLLTFSWKKCVKRGRIKFAVQLEHSQRKNVDCVSLIGKLNNRVVGNDSNDFGSWTEQMKKYIESTEMTTNQTEISFWYWK